MGTLTPIKKYRRKARWTRGRILWFSLGGVWLLATIITSRGIPSQIPEAAGWSFLVLGCGALTVLGLYSLQGVVAYSAGFMDEPDEDKAPRDLPRKPKKSRYTG